MILSLLNPMLIINDYESSKENMKKILKKSVENEDGLDIDETIKIIDEQDTLKTHYMDFIRTDLALETVYQTAGQMILFVLASENLESTATTGGTEFIFKKESSESLILSILLSLKTCISLHFKAASLEKPFFPITSKEGFILFDSFGVRTWEITPFMDQSRLLPRRSKLTLN